MSCHVHGRPSGVRELPENKGVYLCKRSDRSHACKDVMIKNIHRLNQDYDHKGIPEYRSSVSSQCGQGFCPSPCEAMAGSDNDADDLRADAGLSTADVDASGPGAATAVPRVRHGDHDKVAAAAVVAATDPGSRAFAAAAAASS